MAGFKFISVFTICTLLAGCSPVLPAQESVTTDTYIESGTNSSNNSDMEASRDNEGGENAEGNESVQSSTVSDKVYSSLQPGQRTITGELLNFEVLDKLSNDKLSWWITLNREHKTPAIPANIKNLIQKYDGIYVGDTSKKVVYLTFDEGYENGYTAKILDTLKTDDVKAVFFVTGPYIKQQQTLVKRMLDEGHQVGNHTVNHLKLTDIDGLSLENELYGLEKQFSEMYGKGFKYIRPPEGIYSERTLAAAKQLGYKTIFWSFAYKDFDVNDQKGPEYAYSMVMNNLHNGAVILLHAVSKDNAEALDRIIKGIRTQGYEIKPLDL